MTRVPGVRSQKTKGGGPHQFRGGAIKQRSHPMQNTETRPAPQPTSPIIARLTDVYGHCESREDFLVIALDAIDQAGAPLHVQEAVRAVLSRLAPDSTDAAHRAVRVLP